MHKKLIALAVASVVSGGAFAQSNVTVSGVIDMSYIRSSAGGFERDAIESGAHDGSRLTFKGEEALGNGIKAVFHLEYGLSTDRNSSVGAASFGSGSSTRQAFVGLTGNFGTLSAGRVYGPMNIINGYDVSDATVFSAMAALHPGYNTAWSDVTRLSNTMMYQTPSYGGFKVTGVYGTGTNDSVVGNDERVLGFAGEYSAGPLSVTFAHQRYDDRMVNSHVQDVRDNSVAGSFDFGKMQLVGVYYTSKRSYGGTTDGNLRQWNIGGIIPTSANGLIRVQFASLSDRLNSNADAKSWMIGYDHNLSKRTMAYFGYNRTSNDNGADYGPNDDIRVMGANATMYGVGLRHAF